MLHCHQAAADLKEGQLVVPAGHISAWPRLKDGEGSPPHRGCCATARQHCANVHNQRQRWVVSHLLQRSAQQRRLRGSVAGKLHPLRLEDCKRICSALVLIGRQLASQRAPANEV